MLGVFTRHSIDEVRKRVEEKNLSVEWLWPGYLARGQITVITSMWKAGKTTLLVELLRAMGAGEPFLGRAVVPGKAVVLTEELLTAWSVRHRDRPFGDGLSLVKFTDNERPTPANWTNFLRGFETDEPDLLVLDPLANFLPPHAEGNTESLLRFLGQLRNFARVNGPAILLLHHPRKDGPAGETTARGAGVLSSFADVLLEFKRYAPNSDDPRRTLTAHSRFAETPRLLSLERDAATGRYAVVENPERQSYQTGLATLRQLLADHPTGLTAQHLRDHWPPANPRPSRSVLYEWLRTACEEGTLTKDGQGTSWSPVRFWLAEGVKTVADNGTRLGPGGAAGGCRG